MEKYLKEYRKILFLVSGSAIDFFNLDFVPDNIYFFKVKLYEKFNTSYK